MKDSLWLALLFSVLCHVRNSAVARPDYVMDLRLELCKTILDGLYF